MARKKFMKTNELVAKIVRDTGLTNAEVKSVLNSLKATIIDEVANDKIFYFLNILAVEKKYRAPKKEREEYHFITGERHIVKGRPGKNVIKSRALKRLKDIVLGEENDGKDGKDKNAK